MGCQQVEKTASASGSERNPLVSDWEQPQVSGTSSRLTSMKCIRWLQLSNSM
jgi:hypothetical protein